MAFKLNILICLAYFVVVCYANGDTEWWKHAQLYQIYPRSYMDSNGDGIGDIQGIINKLDHIADIGADAVWLSPVFVSPMKDFGYDISNFFEIAKEYGTLEDMRLLVTEAKKLGLRILLDFVPNHTSDQCEWFLKSVKKEIGFENFYVWHPGKPNPDINNLTNIAPSNWISVFRNSAWTWHPDRKEYYLHQFLPQQPDLNYREPAVRDMMKKVLRFWLDIEVDGFRVDAIPHLVEADVDEDEIYPDEPKSNLTEDENDYNYLSHIHTREREETWANIFEWRETMDEYSYMKDTKVILMEASSETSIVMKYYGNDTHEGAHFPFNFDLVNVRAGAKADQLKSLIDTYMSSVPEGRVPNWVAGNHDQPRMASRVGSGLADGIMMMTMLLPGAAVTYQGEEIGMLDQHLSYKDTQDPQACKDGPEMYHLTSRDPQRTPFQWDNTPNAGFSTNSTPWLPIADNYEKLNLLAQKIASRSTYKLYKGLSQLRRSDVVKYGGLKVEVLDVDVLAFSRFHEDKDTVIVLINTGNAMKSIVDLNSKFENLGESLEVLVPCVDSRWNSGDMMLLNEISLKPYESLVFKNSVGLVTTSIITLLIGVSVTVFSSFFIDV